MLPATLPLRLAGAAGFVATEVASPAVQFAVMAGIATATLALGLVARRVASYEVALLLRAYAATAALVWAGLLAFAVPDAGAAPAVRAVVALAVASAGASLVKRAWQESDPRPERSPLTSFAAAGLVAIGSIGLAGWLANLPIVTHAGSATVAMSFGAATCLVLLGVSSWQVERGRLLSALLLAVGSGVLAMLVLAEEVFALTLQLGPFDGVLALSRMAAISAVTLLLAASALVLSAGLPRSAPAQGTVWALGLLVFAIGLTALLGYVLQAEGLRRIGGETPMGLLTAGGALVLGTSLLLPAPGRSPRLRTVLLPALVGLAGLALALGLWLALENEQLRAQQRDADAAASATARGLAAYLDERVPVVERVARQLMHFDAAERPRVFGTAADVLLNDGRGLKFLALFDADGSVRDYVDLLDQPGAAALDPEVALAIAQAIPRARAVQRVQLTAPIVYEAGVVGTVAVAPLDVSDPAVGMIALGLEFEPLLAVPIGGIAHEFGLRVLDSRHVVVNRPVAESSPVRGHALLDVHGRRWFIETTPGAQVRGGLAGGLPKFLLVAGALGALLLAIALRLAGLARDRARASERAADALRHSEASLSRAQRIAGLGSWEVPLGDPVDIDANPLLWSDQTYRLFGYEPGEVEASNDLFFSHVHPDDRDAVRHAVREAMERRGVYSIDHRIVLRDGSVRYVHEEADFVPGPDGHPIRMIGTVLDITERKLAELALADGQRQVAGALGRLRLLLDSSRDLVVVSDRKGRIVEANAAVWRLLGYEPHEMVGRYYVEFVHPDDVNDTIAAANAVLATGSGVNVANRYRHRDGHDVPLMWSAAWLDAEGVAICIGRDVTLQRSREALVQGQIRILEGIARGAPLAETLQALCALLAEQLPGSRVSIVRRDGDRLRVAGSSGLSQSFIEAHALARIGQVGGSCGAAIERNVMVVAEDLEHDPLWSPFREQARAEGVRSCWSAPIQDAGGNAIGSVATYFEFPRTPTADERNLTTVAASMAGVAFEGEAATRELAEIGDRYRLLFERTPMPMWLLDIASSRFVEVNDAAVDHYGWSREQFRAMTSFDIRPEEDRERYAQASRATHSGFQNAGLWRHLRRDGSVIDVEITYYDLDLDGRHLRLVQAKDVTQQLRAQEQVRAHELQLRQVLSDIADAVLVVDGEGRVCFGNPAVEALFGISAEAMVGREQTIAPELLVGGEQLLRTRHGERAVEVIVAESTWENAPARLLTLRDVTERRQAEERLRRNEKQLATAMRIARMASFERDLVSQRWWWSGETRELLNVDAERLAARPELFMDLIRNEDRAAVAEELLAMLHGDLDAADREASALTSDGRDIVVRLMARLERGERGQPLLIAGTIQDVSERRHTEAQLAHLATHDPVTDLPRLLLLEEQAGSLFGESERRGEKVVLYYVDLDRFHGINETLGHATGDRVLRAIAGRLRDGFGESGRVARVAGDEFVALVRSALDHDAVLNAERVRERIEAPIRVGDYTVHVTCSIGVAEYPANGDNFGELLQRAEAATNRAKKMGRNAVAAFANEQTDELRDRLALGGRLRDAVRRNELVLHFQPQVSARNGQIVGLESLVRWNSPDFGLVPPGRFIRVAEELGLIVDIGQWVLDAACVQAKAWLDRGHEGFTVAVNVSALQLQRPTFVGEVADVLKRSGLPPAVLEIELTESAIMENVDRMVETMNALRGIGVHLALDDFGIGYSSLSYLKRLPIDKLKVDQSFVRDIVTESSDAAIARAVIAMGHQLRMLVMAEGVETEAQVGYLRRNHCDLFQGYFFGSAVAAPEAEHLLRRRFLATETFTGAPTDRTLLLLDDEENVLRALTRALRRDGYRIFAVSSPREAFDILGRNDVQVIVSDQRMPETDGTEFLSRVKEMYPETVRLILSGYTDLATVTDAINRGAIYRFLTKPWDDDDLRHQIQEAFRTWSTRTGGISPPAKTA